MFINKDTKGHIVMKQKENTVILSKWINLGMSKIYIKDQTHISFNWSSTFKPWKDKKKLQVVVRQRK